MSAREGSAGSSKRPTLADVAALSGMSKSAVSMILNDRPGSRLSAGAVEKVRAAAAQIGYRPNPAAQSLRLGKTRSIGFISDQVTITRFASAMIRGTLQAARNRGHTVLIAETGDIAAPLTEAFDELIHRRVDGVIVGLMAARMVDVPPTPPGIPVVIVNGSTPNALPSVLPDEYAAGHRVAASLLDAGHTRIGFVGDLPKVAADPRQSVTISRRLAGIRDEFSRRDLRLNESEVEDWHPAIGFATVNRMLDADPGLTAFIAATDGVAFGIYQAIAERGLRVPDDISVVSFDDEELASLVRPGLTTARLPYEQMARIGVEMLLGVRDFAHELVPMPLIVRESIAAR
ncbi:MAG: LacI family DNA-binding transcriptional regulator [Microbacterium sp.]